MRGDSLERQWKLMQIVNDRQQVSVRSIHGRVLAAPLKLHCEREQAV